MANKTLMQAALRYLNLRPRSQQEIETRLAKITADRTAIAEVVSELAKAGLVNDERMGRSVADSLLSRTKGPLTLKQKTAKLGLDLPQVTESEWQEAAAAAVVKLAKKYQDKSPLDQKRLLLAALARRGFSRQQAWRAIDDWLKDR